MMDVMKNQEVDKCDLSVCRIERKIMAGNVLNVALATYHYVQVETYMKLLLIKFYAKQRV